MTIHGSSSEDTTLAVDGMRINTLCGQGQYSGFYLNDAAAQEITYITGAESAEVSSGGMRINVVPKDGGNRFAGSFFAQGANGPLQADNRTDYVKQFLTVPPGIDYEYQINPSYGGPIKRDRLWCYLSYRYNGYQRFLPGAVFADGSPVPTNPMQGNYSLVTRVTWQATQANKFRVYLDRQYNGEQYNNPQYHGLAGSCAGGVRRRLDAAGEVVEHADVAAAVGRGDYPLHASVRRRLSEGGRAPRLAELRTDHQ